MGKFGSLTMHSQMGSEAGIGPAKFNPNTESNQLSKSKNELMT